MDLEKFPEYDMMAQPEIRVTEECGVSELQSSVTASKVNGGVSYRIDKDSVCISRIDIKETPNASSRNVVQ